MEHELLDKVADVKVGRVKDTVADEVEDGIDAAKRALKQGRRAAEDLVDEAEHRVKQHPLSTLGAFFGMGLGLGAVIGILLTRNGHSGK